MGARSTAIAAGLALALAMVWAARAQLAPNAADAARANGVMSGFVASGGDRAQGEALYKARCASCHDNPTGRTPAKAVVAANTRTMIAATLIEGVMAPMARGLGPGDIAALAAYLSERKEAGLGAGPLEAPACKGKAGPLDFGNPSNWNGWGRTSFQTRFQPHPGLRAEDVPRLKLTWAFAYAGSRNGQATVVGDRLFLTSTSGAVYALNARTGCAWWRFDIPGGSRSSALVTPLLGKGGKDRFAVIVTGWTDKNVYALDADTGRLIWKTLADEQKEVQMTGSPVSFGRTVYVPVSSAEEAIATDDAYECCKFRGAVVALDAATGRKLWESFVAPPAQPFKKNPKGTQMYGPAGGAIWSSPTIDAARGVLYVATGDSYTDVDFPNYDAIVAMDLRTGAIRWSRRLAENDNYIIGCEGPAPRANCPKPAGPDYDFGASPILMTLPSDKAVLLAGQKSSQVYALDPDAQGAVIWQQRLSQGGPLGGVEFSLAADEDDGVVFAPIADIFTRGKPARGLYAFRIADGTPLWSAPSPVVACAWKGPFCSGALSQAISATHGVVFAGAMDGRFRAYDSATGKVVWEYDTGQKVRTVSGKEATGGVMDGAGPTIAHGFVYVNSGYQGRSGVPGVVLMAFSVDGR